MKPAARIALTFVIALLLLCAITAANTEILAAHNAYRNDVGVAPLTYNTTLAAGAQAWAVHDASIGSLVHSDPGGNYGENIAVWSTGGKSWTDIVDLWASEEQYFIYGPFNNNSSSTGYWGDIGHYTQIIWNTTLQIGCGKATNATQGADYFVCRYYPPGNIWGRYPYLQRDRVSDKIGVFRPSVAAFILKNGTEKTVLPWGLGTDTPVAGDWNGDGMGDVGVYRPSIATFILKNGTEKTIVPWGLGTDTPVAGDWNGDGMGDVGVYRPSIQKFILRNGTRRTVVPWGLGTDTPVTGDWNGDGLTDVGVYRPSIQKFILKNGTEKTLVQWGLDTDIPVSGDWNSDGLTDVGVYRPSIAAFILKNGTEKTVIPWGLATDMPVTGKWS